uniref:C1q domain-containing protein n=1 Tax=Esox lucius TaxID=8010 RepID=A0AAY5KXC4_ESOLU
MTMETNEDILYANKDVIEFKNQKADLGNNPQDAVIPKSTTQPVISGSDSPWRRTFLIIAVCLGLLYVLMLAGSIFLFVQYVQTQEAQVISNTELKTQVKNLTAELMVSKTKVADLENRTAELKTQVKNLTAELMVSETKVADLGNRIAVSQVVFAASMGNRRNYGPFSYSVTMVYENVFINSGGAYNSGTGIFTTPVSGVYFFMYSGHSVSTRTMGLWLMKNGVQVLSIFNHALDCNPSYITGSNSISLALEVGDQVYIQLYPYTWVFDDSTSHTTFTGQLLFTL